MKRIDHILILGGGSAGFLAALGLKARVPEVRISVVRSPDIGIIGVGEGTIWTMPVFLHGYLGIDPGVFHAAVRPTYKLGVRFLWGRRSRFQYAFDNQLNWRYLQLPKPNGFYCAEDFDYASLGGALMAHDTLFERRPDGSPRVRSPAAYHLENEPFVAFLETHAVSQGIELIADTVGEVERDDAGVAGLQMVSGRRLSADLYVDASGFGSRLLGTGLGEPFESFASSLFCDRAVVGGWPRSDEPLVPYTTAETMNAGWAWRIEHEGTVNRGYVYSSAFIDDDVAERELRLKNPKLGPTRRVRFASGAYRRPWVGNVVAIGNAAGFVEPMQATGLQFICNSTIHLVDALNDADREIRPEQIRLYNQSQQHTWSSVRRFLSVHYRFNDRLDTPFWHACRAKVDLAGAEPLVEYYQSVGPGIHSSRLLERGDIFGLDGYLVLLVGQGVPFQSSHRPGLDECKRWAAIQENLATRARAAMPQEEALAFLRSDVWQWKPDYYRDAVPWV